MKEGVGNFLWKVSVALYLIVNGVMGLIPKWKEFGDFYSIFHAMFKGNNPESFLVMVASIVALIAGIAIVLELFNVEISFMDNLIFVIAIVWAVYVVIELVTLLQGGINLPSLQMLAVHLMVFSSLLISSKKF
jgi:hypothetical protein